jgi:ABC-2 type transport system ATP-binding protein
MNILSVDQLSKNYGKIQALQQVTFNVPQGTVFGILGPNGSGKTTLLGIIMDVLKSSGGSYNLFESHPSAASRKRIGTLLETPNFYHYLSAEQNLKITASIKEKNESDIDNVLSIVDLLHRKKSKFSTYSLGMKQRLAIAAALIGDPEVLVLDEPTNGLDPVGISEIRTLIKKLSQMGKTIIMASHMLDEVEKVCTHVAILKSGKLITNGPVNQILNNDDLIELSASNIPSLIAILENYPGKTNMISTENLVQVFFKPGESNLEDINLFCFERGIVLSQLQMKRKSLETRFLELTN